MKASIPRITDFLPDFPAFARFQLLHSPLFLYYFERSFLTSTYKIAKNSSPGIREKNRAKAGKSGKKSVIRGMKNSEMNLD